MFKNYFLQSLITKVNYYLFKTSVLIDMRLNMMTVIIAIRLT